jgi:hypothetical protein
MSKRKRSSQSQVAIQAALEIAREHAEQIAVKRNTDCEQVDTPAPTAVTK